MESNLSVNCVGMQFTYFTDVERGRGRGMQSVQCPSPRHVIVMISFYFEVCQGEEPHTTPSDVVELELSRSTPN